ncbi:MAG: hypothetical protein WBQ05_07335 [Candidatus Competibacter denitrificans]
MKRFAQGVWHFFGGRLFERTYRESRQALALLKDRRVVGAYQQEQRRPFHSYVIDYDLTESDLRCLYQQHQGFFYFFTLCAFFALGFGVSTAFSTFGVGMALLAFLVALLFLAQAARHSLRCWQIQQRRLGSFQEWFRQPRFWFPLDQS